MVLFAVGVLNFVKHGVHRVLIIKSPKELAKYAENVFLKINVLHVDEDT